jgi:hypothetical protein
MKPQAEKSKTRELQQSALAFLAAILAAILGCAICACNAGFLEPEYDAELPALPAAWIPVLGAPHWRIEWIGPGGTREIRETGDAGISGIKVMQEWATPIIAYPFWPEQGIQPEALRPCGAIFPFDVEEDHIRLTWRGGVDATVYWELARSSKNTSSTGTPRQPQYFDWPRFRELLQDPVISEELRTDPWLADWKTIAAKTAQSGFDRRRITVQAREELLIPVSGGPWIGSSPFAEPLIQEAGQELRVQVCGDIDTYISANGMIHCTKGAWIWYPERSTD